MSSIETMGISCVDCEKKRGIGPKMLIFSYCPSKFNLHISYAHSTKTPQISFQNLTQTARVPKLLDGAKILPKRSTLRVWCSALEMTDGIATI